jgi:hypothetical protein
MGDIDRVQRITPTVAPHQVSAAGDRRQHHQQQQAEDKLELHVEEEPVEALPEPLTIEEEEDGLDMVV